MNSENFVEAIREIAYIGAIKSTLSTLMKAPGCQPPSWMAELSTWYNALPQVDQEFVVEANRLAIAYAVTAFLSILDGATAIENGPNKGSLELYYAKEGNRNLLNDPNHEPLNDMFDV